MGRAGAIAAYALAALTSVSAASAQSVARPSGPRDAPAGARGERFERRLARIVRERLELTDEQMVRLREVNRATSQERQELFKRERDARVRLRRELARADSADQRRVGVLIDELFAVQRARLEMLQAEQRELSAFLSPVQRARYLQLQEQVHRRVGRAAADGFRGSRGTVRH